MNRSVERIEVLPCLYRDSEGRIHEMPFPREEPWQKDMRVDLYCPSYTVTKGLFGPPRVTAMDISILNSYAYHPDPELEREAGERLLRAVVEREGVQTVQASGGVEALRRLIGADTFWLEKKA